MVVLISICPSSINFSIEALIKEAFIPLSIVKKNAGITRDVGQCPNITGTWWARGPEKGVSEASGAFVLTEPSNYGRGHDSGGATAGIDFSADRATGIYGGSSTVQPASIHALACIKV